MSDTLSRYVEKGLARRLGFGASPAVLVVDMIRGFTDSRCPLGCDLDAAVAATRRLLDAARRVGAPVYFTTTCYRPDMTDAGLFVGKVPALGQLREGAQWVELDPGLGRRDDETLLTKKYASAFFGTPLASCLVSRRIDTLLVCGCTTSGCIRATAVDALQHGFRPMVVEQAVGDRCPEAHAANLIDIEGKYGDVVSLTAVLAYLEGGREAGEAAAIADRGQRHG